MKDTLTQAKLGAAAAASFGVLSPALAQAQELEAAPYPDFKITAAMQVDSHMQKGDSDAQGDRKVLQMAARTDAGTVIGFETGIVTPEFSRDRTSFDTSYTALTVGQEQPYSETGPQRSFYMTGGVINGKSLSLWHDIVKKAHGGTARTSPASSGGRILAGVAIREDRHFSLADIGPLKVKAHSVLAGVARTDKVAAQAGGFVSLGGADHEFRPHITDTPVDHQSHSSLYAGVIGTAKFYDLATERLGTQFGQVTAVAGAAIQFNRLNVRAEVQQDLMKEISHPIQTKPVSRYMASVGLSF